MSRMIRVSNMCVVEDFYVLTTAIHHATHVMASKFANSPFSTSDASENALSDSALLSLSLLPHSTLKSVPDNSSTDRYPSFTHSTMQSPCDAPSSPISQSRLRPRGRRSTYLVNRVPTLVCEVPVDVVSVPHQYNHVPRGPLIPRPAEAHEGGCLLYTSPSPRDRQKSRMPSSA